MKIGTRSLLFGGHQFIIHPIMVLLAWIRLYDFPKDYRIIIAIVVHDWGYWNKPNIDGIIGKKHPELGGKIMGYLFDKYNNDWFFFTYWHSRWCTNKYHSFYPSRLCYADKLAFCYEIKWFFLLRITLSEEIKEFLQIDKIKSKSQWFDIVKKRTLLYVGRNYKNYSY
jgi:hypothetical protein